MVMSAPFLGSASSHRVARSLQTAHVRHVEARRSTVGEVRIGILGPVEVSSSEGPIGIDTAKERALLATLAARTPAMVPTGTLIEALWGDDPPATAERTLASHVSRLRRSMGADAVHSEDGGYRLDADVDVDASIVSELLEAATAARASARADVASRRAAQARALWRGEPLLDLADCGVRAGERARLDELHRRSVGIWIDAELALGHHDAIVGEIESQIAEHPFDEPLWGRLMIALYRCGRQADALRAFERLRKMLREDLGIDPSPAVARIELQILRQDPRLELEAPAPPTNLPTRSSSFVGRNEEIRSIVKALDEHRLVTLVGPGGIGKSRLAIAAASEVLERYPDGAWWVDLAPARDVDALTSRLAAGLGLTSPAECVPERVVRHLARHPEALIVFDNCEHLRSATSDLIRGLLDQVPALTVLATSRERLGLVGEWRYVVPPMSVPSPDADVADQIDADAVRLFLDRASDVNGAAIGSDDVQAAATICRSLDGVPLALELAASRTLTFTPARLAAQISDRIGSISHLDQLRDTRYRSLAEAIGWSHDLLEPASRQLFAQLSVFCGGFDLGAVVAVCRVDAGDPVDLLAHLVDVSLVEVVVDDDRGEAATTPLDRRFRLLAPIRDFAAAQLAGPELSAALDRHRDFYRTLASGFADTSGRLTPGAAQRFRIDADNCTRALERCVSSDATDVAFDETLDFGLALGATSYAIGDLAGSVRILDDVLGLHDAAEDRLGWAHFTLVWPLVLLGDHERAADELDRAEAAADRLGDARLSASTTLARAHSSFLVLGDIDGTQPLYERALSIATPETAPLERVGALLGLAQALVLSDRPEGVVELLAEASALLDVHPDEGMRAHLCLDEALLAWCRGDLDGIRDPAIRGQRHADAAGTSFWKQINLTAEGVGLLVAGDLTTAEITFVRAARSALVDGNMVQFGIPLQGLAAVAARMGEHSKAAMLLGAGTAGTPDWPLLGRGLAPYLEPVRAALGDAFHESFDAGRQIDASGALALALGPS